MDYEKAYKEALERAKGLIDFCSDSELKTLENVFPELRESEDERIMKGILHLIDCASQILPEMEWCKANVSIGEVQTWLEKQKERNTNTHLPSFDEAQGTPIVKQGKQKPADEPKFNVDDWIVRDLDNTCYQIKKCILNVTNNKYGYDLTNGGYISSQDANFYHLWTIQDAKDGDVLVANECYVIFKEIDGLNIKCHCTYHYLGFNKMFFTDTLQNKDAFHPATKEERDALMKAMTDEGWEFDFEKKELKKIEQKPVKVPKFKVGDFIQFNGVGHTRYTIKEVCGFSYYINSCNKRMDMSYTDANFELVKQKQEWSEEDKTILKAIILNLEECSKTCAIPSKEYVLKCIIWLKSLKERYTWKPSDEQMKALDNALSLAKNCGEESAFDLRTLYEQLKQL